MPTSRLSRKNNKYKFVFLIALLERVARISHLFCRMGLLDGISPVKKSVNFCSL